MRKTVLNISVVKDGGVLSTGDLPVLAEKVNKALPDGAYQGVVIISGRLPVWAYGCLVHELHPAQAVATFDPRLGGAVVVASHTPDLKVGDVVSLDGAETVNIEL